MKKLIITGTALFLLSAFARAQAVAPSGLDSIIVEKYYVSDVNDTSVDGTGGTLPINSVTYRIYVDMKPGYKFEAAYGVDVAPTGTVSAGDHELRIQTSTTFFNNIDRGATSPTYSKAQAKANTVMLDSWLTVGSACTGNFGVMKAEDDGVANVVNSDVVLQNSSPLAGIPLTTQDGLLAGAPEALNFVGLASPGNIALFDDGSADGPLFSTYNGSWASLNGSVGPQADNRILIAQMTTNGTFSFMLNVQIGKAGGIVENWVANSPTGNEGTHPTLTYSYTPNFTSIASHNNAATSFNIYPNPTTDAVILDINKASKGYDNSYTVYGVDGKQILSKNLGMVSDKFQERVDLSSVAPGLYFIEVSIDGEKSTKKIVKN